MNVSESLVSRSPSLSHFPSRNGVKSTLRLTGSPPPEPPGTLGPSQAPHQLFSASMRFAEVLKRPSPPDPPLPTMLLKCASMADGAKPPNGSTWMPDDEAVLFRMLFPKMSTPV